MAVADRAGSDVAFRIEPLPALDGLATEWRGIEQAGGSFFTSWTWIGSWLRTLPPAVDMRLIRAEENGRTVGLAIGVFKRSRRHMIVDTLQLHLNATGDAEYDGITIEHNDFAGRDGLLPEFARWFANADCADELVLPGISSALPDTSKLLRMDIEKPGFANRSIGKAASEGVGPLLSRNSRQFLNRSLRGFAVHGAVHIEEAATTEAALEYFGALKELHCRSWERRGKPHAFSKPYFETFHRELIAAARPGRDIQLLRVSAGDHVLGYLYNFRRGDVVYAYQSGFADGNRDEHPGYVSHAFAMEHCAKQGVTVYDFLAGENQLKRSFGGRYPMLWSRFSKPSAALRLESAARRILRKSTGK